MANKTVTMDGSWDKAGGTTVNGVNLTEMEVDVIINGFGHNEYTNDGGAVWTWSIQPNCVIVTEKQISGVVSSLSKKNLAGSHNVSKADRKAGDDDTTWLTEAGCAILATLKAEAEAAKAAPAAKPVKPPKPAVPSAPAKKPVGKANPAVKSALGKLIGDHTAALALAGNPRAAVPLKAVPVGEARMVKGVRLSRLTVDTWQVGEMGEPMNLADAVAKYLFLTKK